MKPTSNFVLRTPVSWETHDIRNMSIAMILNKMIESDVMSVHALQLVIFACHEAKRDSIILLKHVLGIPETAQFLTALLKRRPLAQTQEYRTWATDVHKFTEQLQKSVLSFCTEHNSASKAKKASTATTQLVNSRKPKQLVTTLQAIAKHLQQINKSMQKAVLANTTAV